MYKKERTKFNIQTCAFISVTELVPKTWNTWFWEQITENAPFSWGDNNRSLVTAEAFADHCAECLDDSSKVKKWLKKIYELGQTYIDLES